MQMLVIGCGYLGLRVARAWQSDGHVVHALTRSTARADELRAAGLIAHVGDTTDASTLRALPEVDVTLHAVGYDRNAGPSQREVYVEGLRNVVRGIGGRTRQLIQISSTSVYGQDDGEWVDERSDCQPQQPNGVVCRDAEQTLAAEMAPHAECAWQILRLSGIYGPRRLLQRVAALRSGAELTGNPEAWLNLIHVDDAARVVQRAAERPERGRVLLVSDDRPILRRTYYETLARLVAAPRPRFAAMDDGASERRSWNKRCRNARMHEVLDGVAAQRFSEGSEGGALLRFPTIESGLPQAIGDERRH